MNSVSKIQFEEKKFIPEESSCHDQIFKNDRKIAFNEWEFTVMNPNTKKK